MAIVTVGGINSRLTSLEGNTYRKNEVFTQAQINEKLIGSPIPSGADLNSYQTPGDYYQTNNEQAAAGSNYPFNEAGHLTVDKSAGVTQTYTHYLGNRYSVRGLSGSSWSGWTHFYSTDFKPSAADVGALTQAQADARYIQKQNEIKVGNYIYTRRTVYRNSTGQADLTINLPESITGRLMNGANDIHQETQSLLNLVPADGQAFVLNSVNGDSTRCRISNGGKTIQFYDSSYFNITNIYIWE